MMNGNQNPTIIEIGCGDKPRLKDSIKVDARNFPNIDIVTDLNKPLPIDSDKYDIVYCEYAIEHISWRYLQQFINEIYRILKPGGNAEIITANLRQQAYILYTKTEWVDNDLCMVFGDQDYPENTHRSGFSPESVIYRFKNAGFSQINILKHPICDTDMIIIAIK